MAQFSSVAGIAEMNSTLKAISDKLAGGSTSDALPYVGRTVLRSEEHTSEHQSLMRTSYAVFCLKKQTQRKVPHCRPLVLTPDTITSHNDIFLHQTKEQH